MIAFSLIAALIFAGALLAVLPPLIQRETTRRGASRRAAILAVCRDQLRELDADLSAGALPRERYQDARADIERRLLAEWGADQENDGGARQSGRSAAILVGLALPLAAIAVYWLVGSPHSLAPAGGPITQRPHALDTQQVEAMVTRLAARLSQNPEDAGGWAMLARSYGAMRRYEDAVRAYANAAARSPADAQLLADYADAVAMTQGRRLQGEPEALIARALAADPNHVKALSLAGSAAFEKRQYAAAIERWQRILELVPAEAEVARSIRGSIADAQARARNGAATPAQGPGRP